MENYQKILVYRIGHLGDTLVSLPAFWSIRRKYPNSHISLLTNSNINNPQYILARNVLPAKDLFDDWLVYPTDTGKIQTVATFGKLFFEIKRRKFDTLFYLTTRNRTVSQIKRDVLFFRAAGIKKIIGTEYLQKNLLDNSVPRPLPFVETEREFLLNCLEFENLSNNSDDQLKPDLLITGAEKNRAYKWLEEKAGNYLQENKLLAVAPSGKWESKIWAEESFVEVVQKLIETENVYPVIFGGGEDAEKGNRMIEKWKKGANAAGILNIRQAAAALEMCRVYLGNDTGTMHLAASVGTPCVAVFSAIDWAGRWLPFGANHKVFRETVPCEGCLSSVCQFQKQCLTAVKPEEVYIQCRALWNLA